MRLFILLSSLFAASAMSIFAAGKSGMPDAAEFFRRAPFDIASGLTEYSRLDMIDYYTHGSSVKTENGLGQKISVSSLSDDMITFCDEDSVITTIAILTGNRNDTLLMVIHTIPVPIPDSSVSFYDSAWQPLAKQPLTAPTLKNWMPTSVSKTERTETEEALPFMTSTANYDPQTHKLTYTNTIKRYFSASDTPEALSRLHKQLTYDWNGRNFILTKDE